jgi:hypothetical protein
MTIIGISLMYVILGVEFTGGFLDRAKALLSDPITVIFRSPKGH